MKNLIPEFLFERLIKQYDKQEIDLIMNGYLTKRPVTLRVNTIKSNINKVKEVLNNEKIRFKEVEWYSDALILEDIRENEVRELEVYKNGEIYLQSLSSMVPAIILNPKEGENILDMAAAPRWKNNPDSCNIKE